MIATERISPRERDKGYVTIKPLNATYRVVAFIGSVPDSDRARTELWIADQSGSKIATERMSP
ncbi:hypothetical protein Taro_015326 [Colocasia esculenta]|uniref:Uncharacterized protein n=1 Tax=Colocasia esculenta TaxID=4460 RepID=A0A843UHH4_COLES|nr:hypothetical protein [Colocasia esculenta]